MNARQALGVLEAEPRGDEGAPVAALGGEAAIAQDVGHQSREDVGDLLHAEAQLIRAEGESVARQRRRDDGERVRRVAAEARRVGQHRDQPLELHDRARPTVREQERQRRRTDAGLVDEVELDLTQLDRELTESVESRLVSAPVVARAPVLDQPLGRVACDAEAERLEARALAVDQRAGAELLGEAPELAARRRALLQVDEVHGDAALLEEALRLARVLAVGEAEDLGLEGDHAPESDASRLRSSCQALSGTVCAPGWVARLICGPWKSDPPVATSPSRAHISRYVVVWSVECSG